MRKTSKIAIVIILLAVLLLGIGYAAIQNVTLNIIGTAVANPDQANFTVQFVKDTIKVSDEEKATAGVTDNLNATMVVNGLTAKGDEVTATYTVQNTSKDLSADLKIATTNDNTEYFLINSELEKTSLIAGEATTVVVTVRLTKTLIDSEEEKATIGIKLTAMPVEPGMEGTSQEITSSSQSPEKVTLGDLVTNSNIGDYIDLGNNIVGETTTTDDWRILYVDETNNTAYAILADYLPNSTSYAANAGLDTVNTYNVYSNQSTGSRDILLAGLTTTSYWSELMDSIKGAVVTGAPTGELLMKSYNTKNGTELVYTGSATLDKNTEVYDLYVPHTEKINECSGYWLASSYEQDLDGVYATYFDGNIYDLDYFDVNLGIRPVIEIPLNTEVNMNGENIKIKK